MKRENGFYWVRIDFDWIVAEWEDNGWTKTGNDVVFDDDDFDQINENKIVML